VFEIEPDLNSREAKTANERAIINPIEIRVVKKNLLDGYHDTNYVWTNSFIKIHLEQVESGRNGKMNLSLDSAFIVSQRLIGSTTIQWQ
jgi:hypothetical protein